MKFPFINLLLFYGLLLSVITAQTPAPTATNSVTDKVTKPDFIVLEVRSYETLPSIASGYGILVIELANYNNLKPFDNLVTGSQIKIPLTKEVKETLTKIDSVIEKSGAFFKDGLKTLQDGMRPQSGDNFDNSLKVFLYSTINPQRNQKLNDCYNQLVETIYRIEFPNNQLKPNIRSLSTSCGWNISNETADNVVALVSQVPTQGFKTQEFKPSNLDELSKLELGQYQQMLYSRPTKVPTNANSVRIVKAQSGDTIATLAAREKVSAVDVAKINGLLPTTKLVAGREIKIPIISTIQVNQKPSQNNNSSNSQQNLGEKPVQAQDGKVKAIINYFNENLHDPYSMRFVRWSKVFEKTYLRTNYWAVQVKYRAKNTLGAYVLTEIIFYIKNNKVVAVEKLY